MTSPEKISELIRSSGYSPMKTKELAGRLSVPKERRGKFENLLRRLEVSGEIVQLRDGRWAEPSRESMLVGRLDRNPRGFGFVMPVRPEYEDDVFIPEQQLGGAMDGDIVLAKFRVGNRKKRSGKERGPSGSIVRVIERAHETFVGTFRAEKGKRAGVVTPDEPSLEERVIIPGGNEKGAKDGEKVVVKITEWPDPQRGHKSALGEVLRAMGTENTPEIDELSIIHQFNLPEEFPEDVVEEASKLPYEAPESLIRGRRDLSDVATVAVDPDDAKDCDDALSVTHDEKTGKSVVLVHIADVSCYVRPGTLLDREAYKRGLSVYLVRSFIPMIPRETTQQKLSLAEGVKKAAKTVELHFDSSGELTHSDIYHSVVTLDKQMTYKQVQRILEGDEAAVSVEKGRAGGRIPEKITKAIRDLDALAGKLRLKRKKMGSVDLDVPEYEVDVGEDGKVSAVSQIERDRSHSLVEEFMLAANVAVATFLNEKELPAIYRVHEKPDEEDLEAFADFVKTVLERKIDPFDRGAIQQLLLDVQETNFSEAVNMELLRCMKRAEYTPECSPHFALHFPVYCHFTSPIRRYPDLVVHQILDSYMDGRLKKKAERARMEANLSPISRHCSIAEGTADKAEREIVKLKLLRFLQERGVARGEVFEGVITGVKEFGFFAQLQEFSIEGLVKVHKLKGDYYEFHSDKRALVGRKTHQTFRLGRAVRLRISNIDMAKRQLDFDLA